MFLSVPFHQVLPRLIRATSCRLVQEEETVRLYYSTENTREFKEVEEQCLEVGEELAPAVEHLVTTYPAWTKVMRSTLEWGRRRDDYNIYAPLLISHDITTTHRYDH